MLNQVKPAEIHCSKERYGMVTVTELFKARATMLYFISAYM